MRRVDVLSIGDDPNDETLECGIILHDGTLICAEGDSNVAADVIGAKMLVDDSKEGVSGADDPDAFFQWAELLLSGISRRVTAEFSDDDALYDLDSGLYVGDAENPPLPDESE